MRCYPLLCRYRPSEPVHGYGGQHGQAAQWSGRSHRLIIGEALVKGECDRHQAPSGKPDPRLGADVDHSRGTCRLCRDRVANMPRLRAAATVLIRLPASEALGQRLSLTAAMTATTAATSALRQT